MRHDPFAHLNLKQIQAADVAYRDNSITTQAGASGTVTGGVNAGGNVCNGSLTCP